jgi:hypothetical protein
MLLTRTVRQRDRALCWLTARPSRFALVVLIFAIGLYASTATKYLQGYEPETAATAEGLIRAGDFEILPDSIYVPRGAIGQGIPGRDHRLVGRAGLPQPLFMAPFYAAGSLLDDVSGGAKSTHFRQLAILFYNPAVAAISAALFYLIVLRIRRSVRWALGMAVLFTVASITWPYASIGMDTTGMLSLLLTLTGVVYATPESAWPWVLAGAGAGMAVAVKLYELLPVLLMLTLLWRPLSTSTRERRIRLLLALAIPFLLWMIAVGWFNWFREGSIFAFRPGTTSLLATQAAPLNVLGYFVSPGKGLLFYSPLTVLGILGLVKLWKSDRHLAAVIVGAVATGTVFVAINVYWTDETWGPRYLVPVAWLLLLPIPWWVVSKARRRVLAGATVCAVAVQLAGVIAPYSAADTAYSSLAGLPVYRYPARPVPYGQDTVRWIPELSPVLVQGLLVASSVATHLGAPPITYTYSPFGGFHYGLTMTKAVTDAAQIPNFWWLRPDAGGLATSVFRDAMILAALVTTTLIASAIRRPQATGSPHHAVVTA